METDSGQRAMSRRREGAKERRERRWRAEAYIRLQLCRDAVRIASHGGADGCRRAHTNTSTQTGPVDEPPVTEYVAPAPAVVVHSHQLFLVLSTATIATDDNFDMAGLVYPQFSSTAVEPSAPQAVVSVPPFQEFTEPVYNQVHQEQIATGEMTLSIVEYPAVQEQAIVQEIPLYVAPAPVIENIAPAPALTSDAHCQQLPPVYTTTTVTTDNSLDMTGLV